MSADPGEPRQSAFSPALWSCTLLKGEKRGWSSMSDLWSRQENLTGRLCCCRALCLCVRGSSASRVPPGAALGAWVNELVHLMPCTLIAVMSFVSFTLFSAASAAALLVCISAPVCPCMNVSPPLPSTPVALQTTARRPKVSSCGQGH